MNKPEFATNRLDEHVGDAIAAHIGYVLDTWAKPFEVAIASAYFNPGGFSLLADVLERVSKVRLLLGVPPASIERPVRRLTGLTGAGQADPALREALSGHRQSIEEDRDLL